MTTFWPVNRSSPTSPLPSGQEGNWRKRGGVGTPRREDRPVQRRTAQTPGDTRPGLEQEKSMVGTPPRRGMAPRAREAQRASSHSSFIGGAGAAEGATPRWHSADVRAMAPQTLPLIVRPVAEIPDHCPGQVSKNWGEASLEPVTQRHTISTITILWATVSKIFFVKKV